MRGKSLVWTIGKLLLGGLAFVLGSVLGGMLASLLGIPLPVMPAEIDPVKAGQLMPLIGILMAGVLAVFSKQSGVAFLPRWLILGLFSWTAYGLNNYLESKLFMPDMATSYVLVFNLVACFGCAAVVAWLFKPDAEVEPFWARTRAFCAARSTRSWTWRFLAGLAAFPAAYFVFGWMVAPFVLEYYQQQYSGLALPTQDVMLALAFFRSLLFLLSILPVMIAWKGSRTGLLLALGTALFLMVGGLNMLQAVWMPVSLRGAHSLEILADSFVHAAALVYLLQPPAPAHAPAQSMVEGLPAR